ncbi:CobW family GTP-binding protein [Williamsia muralis]|uniref:Cobalamin biosynthesis protein CobW n=1 Tax=Williamsia marianensis TaxID=85044 RepID=A0A2G3PIV8_WILMA|nr:GTP-binding protein [Williamsia marianensis]PHV65747.1 cobalamin biosynthesis protein CobW [Williamsia marianensis]
MKTVPVLIVAGFLGAGKTTLLNHLLRNRAGLRIGVVVNDFGAVNIDAMLVAGQVDGTVALGNGCMCCTVDDEGLEATFAALTTPRAALDLIVVEASGLAEPRNLVRMVAASTHPRIEYGGLVYLVDAANYEATRERHPQIDQHVALADIIVMNKVDLAQESSVDAVRDRLRERNATAPIVATSDSAIDVELLLDADEKPVDDKAPRQLGLDELLLAEDLAGEDGSEEHCGHLHHDYQSVSVTESAPMNPRALATFLEQPPAGVFRIKGFVFFDVVGHRQKYVLHTVGNYVTVHAQRWEKDEPRRAELVVIGVGIDEEQVRRVLLDARADGDVDKQAMLSLTRYLR